MACCPPLRPRPKPYCAPPCCPPAPHRCYCPPPPFPFPRSECPPICPPRGSLCPPKCCPPVFPGMDRLCLPSYRPKAPRVPDVDQRPFITNIQVLELRPKESLKNVQKDDIPGIKYVKQVSIVFLNLFPQIL